MPAMARGRMSLPYAVAICRCIGPLVRPDAAKLNDVLNFPAGQTRGQPDNYRA